MRDEAGASGHGMGACASALDSAFRQLRLSVWSRPMSFLVAHEARPVAMDTPAGWQTRGLYLGLGTMPLEVVVFDAGSSPSNPELRRLHAQRIGKRAAVAMIVALWGDRRAALAGPAGGELVLRGDLDRGLVERLCTAALACRDRNEVHR